MQARALIVDDDPLVCEFMKQVLVQAMGVDVLALSDSLAAATYVTKEKFRVILLDLKMPAPDGNDLTRQARTHGPNQSTPIVVLSEDQTAAAFSHAFAAGAQFFLYKPIDKTRLLRLLRATQGAIEQERRRFRRIPVRVPIHLRIDDTEMDGETIDMSLNGVLAQTTRTIPSASRVEISVYVSNIPLIPIRGSGSVVRVLSGNRVGIQLERLTPSENGRLREFLLPLILKEEERFPGD